MTETMTVRQMLDTIGDSVARLRLRILPSYGTKKYDEIKATLTDGDWGASKQPTCVCGGKMDDCENVILLVHVDASDFAPL